MKIKNIKRFHIYCLSIILMLGSFLYFYSLGKESLLTDEYLSLHVAEQPLKNIILFHNKASNPNTIPPLYEILSHFWLRIFGVSEFAQRALSALFGIFSIYVLYMLAKLLFDTPTGLLSALFGTLSFSWFYYFRQNRCYGLFMLLTLISFYIFFYHEKNRKSQGVSLTTLIIVNILLAFTHYFSFLVIGLQFLFSFLHWKNDKRFTLDILFMCMWVAFLYLPWYPNLLYDFKREPVMFYKPVSLNPFQNIFDAGMIILFDFHFTWAPVLSFLYLPFVIRGIARAGKMRSRKFGLLYLAAIFIISFILIFSFTRSNRSRYYCAFYFPLSIFLALGMQKLNINGIKKAIYGVIFFLILYFNIADFYDFFHYPLYENWKLASQYIKNVPGYQNKEMVFVFQTRYNPPVFAYYFWQNKLATLFANNISTYEGYERDLSSLGIKHKIYIIEDENISGDYFFEKISSFPEDAWIWVFRYHDLFFSNNFRARNQGRYFFHQIILNKEIPQIDFYLLKKIK